jgi:hypothetical protein
VNAQESGFGVIELEHPVTVTVAVDCWLEQPAAVAVTV